MFIIALHAKDIFDEDVHKTEETFWLSCMISFCGLFVPGVTRSVCKAGTTNPFAVVQVPAGPLGPGIQGCPSTFHAFLC